ncbi:MAG TPA: methylated-DNA--[protein]-cysteine S-methyltransferase [Verrucomicrobiae bacterium]|nr:methylated-DNA--[protein]-cysteine S-methyltransferase [Verrucomicrobiae bacterium]
MKLNREKLWKHPTLLKVWATAKTIPRGRVTTYGQLATAAGFPRAARLAGFALKNTPPHMTLPWHRVLNAQGKISFPTRTRHWREQKKRLAAEGVALINGRVDLRLYGWKTRSDSPLLD